jgi:leucyl aminopeptidase (aminopeptidase T)
VRELRIEAEGTDLTLDVRGRTWVNSDGRRNMPSGEVFTGPHEASANGVVRFDVPSSPGGGRGQRRRARVPRRRGRPRLGADGRRLPPARARVRPGARRLGELGIGTNFGITRPSGMILFDEKIGGTVHLALGRSYPETGGKNESALHWDLICDLRKGGRIAVDGELLQQGGTFVGSEGHTPPTPSPLRRASLVDGPVSSDRSAASGSERPEPSAPSRRPESEHREARPSRSRHRRGGEPAGRRSAARSRPGG